MYACSHPKGKRAYYSEGVITQWGPDSTWFNHNIPSLPGSSGASVARVTGWVLHVPAFKLPWYLTRGGGVKVTTVALPYMALYTCH